MNLVIVSCKQVKGPLTKQCHGTPGRHFVSMRRQHDKAEPKPNKCFGENRLKGCCSIGANYRYPHVCMYAGMGLISICQQKCQERRSALPPSKVMVLRFVGEVGRDLKISSSRLFVFGYLGAQKNENATRKISKIEGERRQNTK